MGSFGILYLKDRQSVFFSVLTIKGFACKFCSFQSLSVVIRHFVDIKLVLNFLMLGVYIYAMYICLHVSLPCSVIQFTLCC